MAELNYRSLADESWRGPDASGQQGDDVITETANRVSEAALRLQERVTGYFRDHDVRDMLDDANEFVRNHPAQALVAAAALGFVAAAVIRRR